MKKFFKILFFIALIAGVVWTFSYLFKKSQPQKKTYAEVEATIGTIQKKTVITGQINPRDEVSIKPQVSGIISKIYKEAGQMVKKDEVIAMVKIIPDVSSLAATESQVKLAKLNLDNVEKTFNRQKTLKDKGLIAAEEFEKSQLEYEQAKENYSNALDQLNIVKEGISKNASEYTNTSIKSTINESLWSRGGFRVLTATVSGWSMRTTGFAAMRWKVGLIRIRSEPRSGTFDSRSGFAIALSCCRRQALEKVR